MGNDCFDSLRELFRNDPVEQQKLREYLNIQSEITLHKLAYASIRSSGLQQEFRMEKEILKLLDAQKKKHAGDQELEKIHALFNDPNNKVSRNALAKAIPYIAEILNDQRNEQNAFERNYFNIGEADIKVIALLAEREEFANGKYASALWKNRSSDKSILNFIKIINSSVRTTGLPSEKMLARMDKRIKTLQGRAVELLSDMDVEEACKRMVASCEIDGKEAQALTPELSEFLVSVSNEIELENKHELLKYDDVWLYAGKGNSSKISASVRGSGPKSNTQRPSASKPSAIIDAGDVPNYEPPVANADEVIHEALIQKILDVMPQLFTRADLGGDKELTVALAQAIDEGVLVKRGKDRFISYKGNKYYIPELWNSTTRQSNNKLEWAWNKVRDANDAFIDWWPNRAVSKTISDRIFEIRERKGDDIQERYKHIDEDDLYDFMMTWGRQKNGYGNEFAFTFKNKLYDLKTGDEIPRGAKEFLDRFAAAEPADKIANSPFDSADKDKVAKELRKGNQSYISGNSTYHVSGAKVDFDREYARALRDHNSASGIVEPFPTKGKVREVQANTNNELVLKSLADRKRAFMKDGKAYDLFRGVLTREQSVSEIISNRKKQGVKSARTPASYRGMGDSYLASNAAAALNIESTFELDGKKYYTDNGRAVVSKVGDTAIKGYHNHDDKMDNTAKANLLEDKEVILEYYRTRKNNKCEYVSMLDKKSSKLEVYKLGKSSPEKVWSTEALVGREISDEIPALVNRNGSPQADGKTPAGVFKLEADNGQPRIGLGTQKNWEAWISAAGLSESHLLNDGNLSNNRSTDQKIKIDRAKFKHFKKNYLQASCPFYILTETDEAKIQIVGDRLALVSTGAKEDNLAIDNSSKEAPKEIRIVSRADDLNDTAKGFIKSLEKNKASIMEDLNLTNSQYNGLAKTAFGILGVESQFGKGLDGGLSPRSHKEKSYGAMLVAIGKLVQRGEFTFDPDDESRGLTQIKEVEQYLKGTKYSHLRGKDLMKPDNAAIATMYVLSSMLDELRKVDSNNDSIKDSNRLDYLYYIYNGQTRQVANASATPALNERAKKVNAYADLITVYSK